MDEAEYLDEQSERAKTAMRTTLHELKSQMIHKIDPRPLTRAHPIASVAVAAATGFAAASLGPHSSSTDPTPSPEPAENGKPRHRATKLLSLAIDFVSFAWPIINKLMAAQRAQAAQSEADSDLPPSPELHDPPPPQTPSSPL